MTHQCFTIFLAAQLLTACANPKSRAEQNAEILTPQPGDSEVRLQSKAIIQKHLWYATMPEQLREDLAKCLGAKSKMDIIQAYLADPKSIENDDDPMMSNMDLIAAHDLAAFDGYCPDTVAQVEKYVP